MDPRVLVFPSKSAVVKELVTKQSIRFSYHIPHTLKFTEPYYARLAGVAGTSATVLVYADFVSTQIVDGSHQQLLGFKSQTRGNFWVPLSSDTLSSTGFITVETIAATALFSNPDKDKLLVVVELAPQSLINGTYRQN